MEKYKLLLTGSNHIIMDDFFAHAQESFIMMSTSLRFEDMDAHLTYFEPDIFVYCVGDESRDDIQKLVELKRKITRRGIVFVIIGSREDCEEFQKIGIYMVDLALIKPITIEQIQGRIRKFMEDKLEEELAAETATEQAARLEKEQAEKDAAENKDPLHGLIEQPAMKHVLIIDDDPSTLKLIKEHLHENYKVATAISGKIAYKFLEHRHTDLILLDYEMPGENGPKVLETLRQNRQIDDIPVLFLTGITDREKIRTALSMKPQGYLLKPIDKEKLLGTIERFIG